MTSDDAQKKAGIASVSKAMRILNCFDAKNAELSLAALSRMTGYPKTTVFGFVNTLLSENLLTRSPSSENYTLGMRLLELSYHTKASLPIIQIAAPILNRINVQSGQNVYLTTHFNGRLLYLESYYRDKEYIGYSETGKTLPMHCTASGKAMLAYMPENRLCDILSAYPLSRSTPNTITDENALRGELTVIRARGYAIDNEEEDIGVKCVAMPILNKQGEPVGGVSVSGSAKSMTDEKIKEYYGLISNQGTVLRLNANLFPYRYLDTKE